MVAKLMEIIRISKVKTVPVFCISTAFVTLYQIIRKWMSFPVNPLGKSFFPLPNQTRPLKGS
jgi:hypothetical protein